MDNAIKILVKELDWCNKNIESEEFLRGCNHFLSLLIGCREVTRKFDDLTMQTFEKIAEGMHEKIKNG